jgi:hypothetical protein
MVYDGNPPRERDPDDDPEPAKGSPGAPTGSSDVKPEPAPKPAQ